MNSVKWPCSLWVLIAQWMECLPGVRGVMGSIPVWDSDFFFVPCSSQVDQLTFHVSLPSTKFTIFIHLSPFTLTATVPILAVCRTPVTCELSQMTLLSMSSRSSVDKAPAPCLRGHGFYSCWALRFFLCSTFMSCWSLNSLFTFCSYCFNSTINQSVNKSIFYFNTLRQRAKITCSKYSRV